MISEIQNGKNLLGEP